MAPHSPDSPHARSMRNLPRMLDTHSVQTAAISLDIYVSPTKIGDWPNRSGWRGSSWSPGSASHARCVAHGPVLSASLLKIGATGMNQSIPDHVSAKRVYDFDMFVDSACLKDPHARIMELLAQPDDTAGTGKRC